MAARHGRPALSVSDQAIIGGHSTAYKSVTWESLVAGG